MTTNNHPAHGPVSLDRLHQIREILSKAAAQSDGGNLGYAMADAAKVIDEAIAAFGAEPVGTFRKGSCGYYASFHEDAVPLYTAPPAPVVPDELTREEYRRRFMMEDNFDDTYRGGWNACRAAMLQSLGNSEQLDEVGSWNNHRNTPTTKPAIDSDELLKHIEGMEVSVDVSTCDADAGHRYFGTVTEIYELDTAKNGYILLVHDAKPNFNHTEQHLDMVDHFVDANEKGKDGTLINEGTTPVKQIKPVADLYGITSPTGSETTFTFDASEASSFFGSGWSVQEYVELERYQEAITGK
ncbi:hypothetical protein TX36_15730 [Salmonella enterica]|nr:hypothetical protein [Salmonella enterica]EBI0514312.1 hypothetical protein [Salmonella enterica subsp. enterica serovar Brunei]EBP3367393.1 hypothetical protein [Salmonella enterica]EEX0137370.1 hypothetical protein [Salmonella enterica]MIL02318.1 hypothetical protein [Salmonella enterica subsp. enterica]